MDILLGLLYVSLSILCPAIPVILSLPVFGDAFLGLMNLSDMGVADFLGCYATAASGIALIVPMSVKAVRGDALARKRISYVAPMFLSVSSGVLSIVMATGEDAGARQAACMLGGVCVGLSILALLVYVYREHKSWRAQRSERLHEG